MTTRYFEFCAKGGHPWRHQNQNFVCPEHEGPGLYTHCTGCGKELPEDRNYVCGDCLVVKPVAS
jgi:hypothetical protein